MNTIETCRVDAITRTFVRTGAEVSVIVGEVDAVELRGVGASPQLYQLVSGFGVKNPDQRPLHRRRRHHRSLIIHRQIRQLALVGLNE